MLEASTAPSERSLIACPSCDLLYDVTNLLDGETARCSRCAHKLTTFRSDDLDRVIAYSSSALIFLLLACSFPFMRLRTAGLESSMTLPQTAIELWQYGQPQIALLVACFIILIPAIILVLVLALSMQLRRKKNTPWLVTICRTIFTLKTWSMVEVFFFGVLVSLVKLAKMADIEMGVSFWAYAAFSLLFVVSFGNLDRYQYWNRIDKLS